MDFAALSPEVNSLRMYTGPGAGPMMAAAAAWNNLASELGATAAGSQSVISELTSTGWLGTASASMSAATTPYLDWMHTTTGLLEQAAAQAMASAAAFETAFAMTVPPPVIATNRALLAGLVATNILGQNAPAIAATEAQYAQMWAQDAAAMYGYAGSSAAASKLSPLTSPASTTASAAGLAGQTAAATPVSTANAQSGLQGLVSNLPSAMQSLASPAATTAAAADPLDSLLGNNVVSALGNGVSDTAAWNMMEGIATGSVFNATVSAPSSGTSGALGVGAGSGVLAGAAPPPSAASAGAAPVLAGAGQSTTVGKLSVPAQWSAAVPNQLTPAAPLSGSGWTAPAEQAPATTNVATGMPAYASAGRGGYGAAPRYGVKPTIMPRQVLV